MKQSKPFSKLTKAEQRVQIVKDTLKWIGTKNVKVAQRDYFVITKGVEKLLIGDQLNKHLGNITCKVCAKGALFLAHVDRFNHCEIERDPWTGTVSYAYDSQVDIKERLSKHFSDLQLDMIEAAFEKGVVNDSANKLEIPGTPSWYDNPTDLGKACIKFGRQYGKAHDRLEAILNNIIKNNGEFKPGKVTGVAKRQRSVASKE